MHAVCLCSIQDGYKCKKGFTVQIATCEDNIEDCRVFSYAFVKTNLPNKNMRIRERSNTSTKCVKSTVYCMITSLTDAPLIRYNYY